jgi:uncharacterized protein (TIGR00730 family)
MNVRSDVPARPVVTVFGSSRAKRGDEEYQAAQRLGRLIGQRGWILCNGGHDGTMEAAARGAKEVDGQTIGISISLYRPASRNVWLDQEIVMDSLFARLERLASLGNAYVVLRGGIGTLLECALVWNLVQSPEFTGRPIVVVGPDWRRVVRAMRRNLPMHPWEADSLTLVETVEEAVARLAKHFERGGAAPDTVTGS